MQFRTLPGDRSMRRPGLTVEELRAADVTAQFEAGADVEIALDEVRVEDADLTRTRGDGRIVRSLFQRTTLDGSQFGPLELSDSRFDGVRLANASWRGVLANQVEFLGCRATGWRFELDRAQNVYLHGCLLDYAVLEVRRVKGLLVFEECSFSGAVLAGDLSNVVFARCDLDEAEFAASAATNCDLRSSALSSARGLTTLAGALIDTEQAMTAGPRLAAEVGLQVSS